MQRLAHWECRDCFKGMQSLHRRLQENWDNCHSKKQNQPRTLVWAQLLLHQRNVTFTDHFYAQNQCHRDIDGFCSECTNIVVWVKISYPPKVCMNVGWLRQYLDDHLTCQVFGKKQLFSVGLVLQKYTGLISLSAPSPSSLCLVSYVNATSSWTSHKFASLMTFFSVWLISHIILLTGYTICRDM